MINKIKKRIEELLDEYEDEEFEVENEFEPYLEIRNLEAQLKGYEQAKKDIIKRIESLENPYPIDIFPEIHEELFEEINQELINKFEFPLDRLSANLMRKARENCKEELIKLIGEKE